jgi:hypothetical protein
LCNLFDERLGRQFNPQCSYNKEETMSLYVIACAFLAILYLALGLICKRKVESSEREAADRLRYRVDEIIHTSRSSGSDIGS